MILAVNTTLQLLMLRELMLNTSIVGDTSLSAYIIPLQDAHQGTRTPACGARLRYISGFSGSSGTVLVTNTAALLWTDGRYFTQANDELDENWTLMREGLSQTPSMEQYLASVLKQGDVVGVDPALYSKTAWNSMNSKLNEAGLTLRPVARNLVDLVWGDARPPCPNQPIRQIDIQFTGKSAKDKLSETRRLLGTKNVEAVVLNQLDDIAWLLNLRGSDIPSAALFLAFAIVKKEGFELFIDKVKVPSNISKVIEEDGGTIYEYADVNTRLDALVKATTGKILLDKTCSYSLVSLVPEDRQLVELSPIIPMKAVKNPTEITGVKAALIRDSAILARLYAWIEKAVSDGEQVTELSVSDKLMSMRQEIDTFLTPSFTTIAGSDANGAIIHYRPTEQTNKPVRQNSMLLIDAGATYLDGTTDITRTFHYGVPSPHQKDCYTRVLKGQIAIARAVFPRHTRGIRLDSFARRFLWEVGLDYGHGTGHGIGINVHEGPTRITYDYNIAPDDQGLRENMLTSNEPGYYEEGSFGIRLENIVRVVNSTVKNLQGETLLAIEDMTFLPYQHKLIKKELLTKDEIKYLNEYQEKCRQIVGAYVKEHYPGDPAYEWIMKETMTL